MPTSRSAAAIAPSQEAGPAAMGLAMADVTSPSELNSRTRRSMALHMAEPPACRNARDGGKIGA